MDAMEIDDDVYIKKSLTVEGPITQVDFQRRNRPFGCVTVCLVLLCSVLLSGNIGQIIYYEKITHSGSAVPMQVSYNNLTQEEAHFRSDNATLTAETHQLQSNYDSLTAERNKLEARLSSLTEEKHQLQQNLESLTTESDEFKASFSNVTNERDQLQASYDALKQESDRLQTSYNDMQKTVGELQTKHNDLAASKGNLQTKYSNLQRERDELQALFRTVTANRDQLLSNYSSLKRDNDQLQSSYDAISIRKNLLETSYNSLWKDKDQLQTRYNTLRWEKQWLQSNYSSLITDRDDLQKRNTKLTAKLRAVLCPTGWTQFDVSCYFVSTMKKNWTESRKACISEGADLVVIDSRDEQVFVSGLLDSETNSWIGLTDSIKEGTWMWVDGTPVTTVYWQPGQPNNFGRKQDCGEIVHKSSGPLGEWNDDGCFAQQFWICEK